MNKNPRIELSVVIPFTNIVVLKENYLEVIRQSIGFPIEFILVFDLGSPFESDFKNDDSLLAREKEFAADNVSLIKGKFENPGRARNEGIKRARGEWIAFWDSDDSVNWLKVLDGIAKAKSESEVLIFDFEVRNQKDSSTKQHKANGDLRLVAINPGIWRMVFRRNLVAGKKFPDLLLGEDQCFLLEINVFSSRICLIDDVAYTYVKGNPDQLTSRIDKENDIFLALKLAIKLVRKPTRMSIFYYIVVIRMFLTTLKIGNMISKCGGLAIIIFNFFTATNKQRLLLLNAFNFVFKHRNIL